MNCKEIWAILATVDWTNLGMLASTIILAGLTGIYVVLTRKLVRAQSEPCVIVFARHDESRPTLIQIVIKNVGTSLARDVHFTLSVPIPHRAFGLDPKNSPDAETMAEGPLIDGIPALAPGEERRIKWGQYGGLTKALGKKCVAVTSTFRSGNQNLDPVESVLEIRSFDITDAVDTDGARRCAKELKRIADKFVKT